MKEIIKQVVHGKVHIHIGKAGLSAEILNQIENLFEKKPVIKVKILNLMNFTNAKQALQTLASLTNSVLVDNRGKTGVLVTNSRK